MKTYGNASKKVTSMARAAGIPRPRWDPSCRAARHASPRDYTRKGKSRWTPAKEV